MNRVWADLRKDRMARSNRHQSGTRMRKKRDLPTKVCAACGRQFTWRRKWALVWDEVRYCSHACRTGKNSR